MYLRESVASKIIQIMKFHERAQNFKIIFLQGPRQSGKTTLMRQLQKAMTLNPEEKPFLYENVDRIIEEDPDIYDWSNIRTDSHPKDMNIPPPSRQHIKWLRRIWENARNYPGVRQRGGILCLDEIQQIANFSSILKIHWDEDRAQNIPLQVIVLGSSPMLMQKKLTESLFMRFYVVRSPHWSFAEMSEAFDYTLDEYIYYGGYPGLAQYARSEDPFIWRTLIDNAIETTLEKDIIKICDINKPALIKSFFEICIDYSGQSVGLNKTLTY